MDEPPLRPVSLHFGLLTAAVALSLVPGCAWMHGTRSAKRDAAPAIEADAPGKSQVAAGQDAAPVGLDGSAANDGAIKTPDAPTVGAAAPRAGKNAEELLAGAPPGGKSSKTANGGKSDLDLDDDEQPKGVVGATGSDSGPGGVVLADQQDGAGAARVPKNGEPLTDLPGSFDVVGDGVKVEQGIVAATVNGQPIFVEDVIRDLNVDFSKAEKAMPPDQFKEWKRRFIEMHLQRPIEEELLLQALKAKLKPEQLKQIGLQVDAMFNKEVLPAVMKERGFLSEAEFEKALRANGSSIEVLRTKNRNREFAQQYIGAKVMPKTGFDRPDLLKYYKEHKEDYAIAAQAKWEQIHLAFSKNGGKDKTRQKADEIIKRLENGEGFGAIARECSNGPNAVSKGGARGWTTRGTLANDALNEALFELPLDEISSPIESQDGIDVVRVVDRTEAGYKPFSAVQEDIKAHLKNEEWTKASKSLFKDLTEKATIIKMTENL